MLLTTQESKPIDTSLSYLCITSGKQLLLNAEDSCGIEDYYKLLSSCRYFLDFLIAWTPLWECLIGVNAVGHAVCLGKKRLKGAASQPCRAVVPHDQSWGAGRRVQTSFCASTLVSPMVQGTSPLFLLLRLENFYHGAIRQFTEMAWMTFFHVLLTKYMPLGYNKSRYSSQQF